MRCAPRALQSMELCTQPYAAHNGGADRRIARGAVLKHAGPSGPKIEVSSMRQTHKPERNAHDPGAKRGYIGGSPLCALFGYFLSRERK